MFTPAVLAAIDLLIEEAPKLGAFGARVAEQFANATELPAAQQVKAAVVRARLAGTFGRLDALEQTLGTGAESDVSGG